jgi:hypothetical protein
MVKIIVQHSAMSNDVTEYHDVSFYDVEINCIHFCVRDFDLRREFTYVIPFTTFQKITIVEVMDND